MVFNQSIPPHQLEVMLIRVNLKLPVLEESRSIGLLSMLSLPFLLLPLRLTSIPTLKYPGVALGSRTLTT